ncbi:CHC2 zinc finger domain-containing protein [Streptomyces sp. NPDC001422]|uniref:CHC2 zinc finger domain-containing protein n=1 Tax=Streptomyces sp. NPDC001422 TaxID=3364575 RepID=UPI00367DF7A4
MSGRSVTLPPNASSDKPPIAEVLRHFYGVEVKERAGWQKMLCPLHTEENPSASANTEKQRWSCFVCQINEDAYDVVRREKELGFREAVAWAHAQFGGGSPELLSSVQGQSSRGVHQRSGPRSRSRQVRSGLGRFGSHWS